MMNRESIARDLEYHIFTTNDPKPDERALFNQLYDFWHAQWFKTFNELIGMEKLYSDDFLRHEHKTCLIYKNQILGYFAFNRLDISLKSHREHSYFKTYPPETLDFLQSKNLNKIMAMGYLSVAPEWRRGVLGSLVADTIVQLVYRRFKFSNCDTLVAFTRNNRAIDDMVYRYGSKCMMSKVKQYNIEVDFVYTLKEDVKDHHDPLVRETVDRLWANAQIHGPQKVENLLLKKVA